MLDAARYYLAYLTLGSMPFALGYWYAIHPFVGFWRRVGPLPTYVAMAGLLVANLWAAWHWREALLAVAYPVGPAIWVAAAASYGVAVAIELQCRRQLKFATLAGLPELVPDREPPRLLDQGIYGRVRHPRYVSVALGTLAAALFCNYQSLWLLTLLMFPGLYGIVLLEERELRDRFGDAYLEYSRRVPRFLPRLG